ncbi:hypothetical protein C0J52_03339 [Blattella germanica]|nr:hypothetical protein C0J52_03339 [Blattella germanica]
MYVSVWINFFWLIYNSNKYLEKDYVCQGFTGVRCLKLLLLDVPSTADMFSPVTLFCEFDTEGSGLYSVKWYKDGKEFFRYMPDYDPPSKAIKSSEVTVDVSILVLFNTE